MLSSVWRMFTVCYLYPGPLKPAECLRCLPRSPEAQAQTQGTAGGQSVGTLILAHLKMMEPGNSMSSGISPESTPRAGEGVLGAPHACGRQGMVTSRPRWELWAPWGTRRESAPYAVPPPACGRTDFYCTTCKSFCGELDFRSFGHMQAVRFKHRGSH